MKYVFGLCEGRHQIPVDRYIFGSVIDPTDYVALLETANKAIPADCTRLVVYVTGLTPAMLAVVAICNCRRIALDAMHYDRDTGSYYRQVVLMAETENDVKEKK